MTENCLEECKSNRHPALRALSPKLQGVYRCDDCGVVVLAVLHCYDMRFIRDALVAVDGGRK